MTRARMNIINPNPPSSNMKLKEITNSYISVELSVFNLFVLAVDIIPPSGPHNILT